MVPKSSRDTICTTCKLKKKKCSIKGVVSRLVATGELGSVEESMNLKISSKEDVIALGLERGAEVILLQLCSLQHVVEERLGAIEARLRAMEKGKGRARDDDDDDKGSGNGDDEMYEDWSGWGS
jgi:hypothetical protein